MMAFQSVTASAWAMAALNRTQVATIRTAGNLAVDFVFANCMAVFLPWLKSGSDRKPNRAAMLRWARAQVNGSALIYESDLNTTATHGNALAYADEFAG